MKIFFRFFLVFSLFVALQAILPLSEGRGLNQEETQALAPFKEGPSDPVELEAFIDGIMSIHLETNHIAGATFSLVKDGELFLAKGYGYADREKKIPVKAEETLFRPGSISKLFVWTAVMQLYEQGKLDLDADINTYLRKFKVPETFPQPITMKHLMSHTAGFEEMIKEMSVRDAKDLVPLGEFLATHLPARVIPPGKLAAYSNYGTALAGYIIEEISGIPFEEYIEEHIFKPLKMEKSTFRQPLPLHLKDLMSVGYSFEKGIFKAHDFELINGLAPAGSMSTTATDMANFMIAHLEKGRFQEKRILKEETIRLMHSRLFTHHPKVNGNAYGFWELKLNELKMIEHGGDTAWFHSFLVLIPEKNVGLFVSYNSAGGGGFAREELVKAFLDRYYPGEEKPLPQPPSDFKKRAKKFLGTYRFTRVVHTSYEKMMALLMKVEVKATPENTLLITLPAGLGAKQWVEVEPLIFQEVSGQDTLVFQEDERGHIIHAFVNSFPYFALVKMRWFETPLFSLSLVLICVLLFLSVLRWPLSSLLRRLCQPEAKEGKKAPSTFRLIVSLMAILYLIFIIGVLLVLSDYMKLMFGVPLSLKILLFLPLFSSFLTFIAIFISLVTWIKGYWSWCARFHYTLIVLGSIAFIWFLNYWNLLGFKY